MRGSLGMHWAARQLLTYISLTKTLTWKQRAVPEGGAFGSTGDAGGGTRTPDTRIMIRGSRAVMRFLYRRSFCRMFSVVPELLSSVHRPVHRLSYPRSGRR